MADEIPYERVVIYDARGEWDEGHLGADFGVPLVRAIIRDDEISIDWPVSDGHDTSILLRRTTGSRYRGESIWASRTRWEERAVVDAVLYSNQEGHVLMAEERWASGEVDWFVVRFSNGRVVE